MAKKRLASGLEIKGIAPNILLQQVQNTAPFIFGKTFQYEGKELEYIERLRFYKKNLKQLKNLNLREYFYLCMSAHWATAGTFVPTDVDNQIREGLWHHSQIQKFIIPMTKIVIDSWKWDYSNVTNRKCFNKDKKQVLSTHEGTWLSVAIGCYFALKKFKEKEYQEKIENIILDEILKEQELLKYLRDEKDIINFYRAAPLIAHNFGDLDRVITQWGQEDEIFCQKIFKLAHKKNDNFDPLLVYAGSLNKAFTSVENHRHMSLRAAKSLRLSSDFLIPVGPFMDDWGEVLGKSNLLSDQDKAEIICCLWEGHKRQDHAFGYCRAYRGLVSQLEYGLDSLAQYLPYDIVKELQDKNFQKKVSLPKEDFESSYMDNIKDFECPETKIKFFCQI